MKALMAAARGDVKAETVLKNARIVNVFTGEVMPGDIAIEQGIIVGIGTYHGKKELDLKEKFVAPGLIDGHVHIESSMMTPREFSKIIVPKGTTTIIADPHEIGNVSGVKGIEFMLENSKGIPLNVHMMIPSCVPATKFENAGATITNEDIKALKGLPGVLGLGEVMDYPAVIHGDSDIHEKIETMRHYPIDGHAPDIVGNDLNAYVTAGVKTDHECTKVESMIERLKRGMYVHLREGSATRNVRTLLKGVTKDNFSRLLFCTDDKHPEDIEAEGHINMNVNLAIEAGIPPIDAIRMATINAANCYGLKDVGAVAPSYKADLIVFDNLEKVEPLQVYKDGVLVAEQGKACFEVAPFETDAVTNTVNIDTKKISFDLKLKGSRVKVIGLIRNNVTTKQLIRTVKVDKGLYQNDPDQDILKLALVERHHQTGNIGLGLVEGYGIQNGAVAMTIAHDSHNLIIVGDTDENMRVAMEKIIELQGGIVVVKAGKVIDALQLEISGIMTNQPANVVSESLTRMAKKIESMGLNPAIDDPFISLAFLSLPVIPELKLTDTGLFDVTLFEKTSIEADETS